MPHFIIDCSKGVTEKLATNQLIQEVYECAISSNLFAKEGLNGIKVRVNSFEHYTVVNSQDDFIHVFAHIMEGRTTEQKRDLSKQIVDRLTTLFPSINNISMNVYEFEKATYVNKSVA